MSAENDVPLGGEGPRRYYEQQFGDRIRKVSKGGAPRGGGKGGGSGGNGRAGCGIVIAIFVGLRILAAFTGSRSTPTIPTYTPPPPIDMEVLKRLNENEIRIRGDGHDLFPPGAFVPPAPDAKAQDDEALLDDGDEVPLPRGLCYRIYHESRQPRATPGGRIWQLLDVDARKLVTRAADGAALDVVETSQLLDALNAVLRKADFSDGPGFNNVPGIDALRLVRVAVAAGPKYNRMLLEVCYPEQIVPLDERDNLDDAARRRWRQRAQADLDKARQQYEPARR